ncbi:hypothetical protein KP509_01G031900 [Ceratopteris richardii]|uniref:Uncharacterized protein n=1 Tax=Ceratopteris richardii TaxID=49495 RepID=A0A8T2VC02_CERRI|nr:hypothetical protein KP509_01G031900 [Ceratopteris richardii]
MVCSTVSLTSTHLASSISIGAQTLSSTSTLNSHSGCLPFFSRPVVLHKRRVTTAVCSLSVETKGARILTSAIGTAAAVLCALAPLNHVVDGPALAASGPGTSGGERTAQKAEDLLKSADKLNLEEAPKRFGPGRLDPGSSANDLRKTAQDAGGRALSQMADGVKNTSSEVADKAKKAQGVAEKSVSDVGSSVNRSFSESGSQNILGSIKERVEGLKDAIISKQ